MGIFKSIGKAFTPVGTVRQMTGSDELKAGAKSIKYMLKKYFVPQEETQNKESFDEAIKRLNVKEAELKKRARYFFRLSMAFLVFAAIVFVYSITLFLQGAFEGGLVSFGVTIILVAVTFRYHFWAFQIKHQKLGCSFKEWWESKIHEA